MDYATEPGESMTVWVTDHYTSARLYAPGSAAMEPPVKRSSGQKRKTRFPAGGRAAPYSCVKGGSGWLYR